MDDTLEKIKKIIVERLGVDPKDVTLEAGIREDLGADSLDVVDLIMEIEDEFELSVKDEDVQNITTVGDIVAYINKVKSQS